MNQLSPTSSFETLVDVYGWYAVTRLDGNPDLAAVAADARSINNDLEQAHLAFRSVVRATMSAASARDEQKYKLDAALRYARTAVLIWVRNRRSSRHYRTIFPGGLTSAICANPERELRAARDVLTKMAGYQVPALEPATEVLSAAIEALRAALRDYAAVLSSRKNAWAVVQGAKVTYCQRYYGLFCQVVQIVGDPALAMTYFRHERRSSGLADGPEDAPDESDVSLEITDSEAEAPQAA